MTDPEPTLASAPTPPVVALADELAGLVAVAARAESTGEEDLLEASVETLQDLLGFHGVAVLELEPRSGALELRYSAPSLRDDVLPRGAGAVVDTVLRDGGAIVTAPTPDLLELRRTVHGPDVGDGGSFLVTPLRFGAARGVSVFDRFDGPAFGEREASVAALAGGVVALGLRARRQVERLRRYRERLREYARLLESGDSPGDADKTLGDTRSSAMAEVVGSARQVAPNDVPVLILGETGSGKSRLARAIHGWSARADEPFVKVNCGAIPTELVESELFGHVRGAFTGADAERHGRFGIADGGTLFLDEIGEMSLDSQVKLLRALEEGRIRPVGADREIEVDVRVIAATHVDLVEAVSAGTFREDLYYRLAVFPLIVPPLRERLEDLPRIARHLLDAAAERTGGGPWVIPPQGMERLLSHPWPGNIRELANCLERARIRAPRGGELDIEIGPMQRRRAEDFRARADGLLPLDAHVRAHICDVLEHTRGRIWGPGGAADVLGLKPTTLTSKMKRLGIDKDAFRA